MSDYTQQRLFVSSGRFYEIPLFASYHTLRSSQGILRRRHIDAPSYVTSWQLFGRS